MYNDASVFPFDIAFYCMRGCVEELRRVIGSKRCFYLPRGFWAWEKQVVN